MKKITGQELVGERALFMSEALEIDNCHFHDGESPLKESHDLFIHDSVFSYKYPLWYGKYMLVKNTKFEEMARAGIWYSEGLSFHNCIFEAPKCFRKCKNVLLEDIDFSLAEETLWWNEGIILRNIKAKNADYLGMGSSNIKAEKVDIIGNYLFDGAKDVEIKDSHLACKDAFWNAENILIEDCHIEGEYFGWNSHNVVIKNSKIVSHQGFCYMNNLTMIDCVIEGSDLTYEFSTGLKVDIIGGAISIKNPLSGEIRIGKVDELIMDDKRIDYEKIKILFKDRDNG